MSVPGPGQPGAGGAAVANATSASAPTHRNYAANHAELPESTLVELFFRAVDEFDKPDAFLRRGRDGWGPVSHREVLADVHALADALVDAGIRRDDRVAIVSENRLEWALADYALMCVGAASVPVYSTLPANQIAHILRHSGARLAFVSSAEQHAKIAQVKATLPALETVVMFDDVDLANTVRLRELLDRGRSTGGSENEFRIRARSAQPSDVATIIYTSGTTGEPKGVMLTHNNLSSNVAAALSGIPVGPADIGLSFLPLSHSFQRLVDFGLFGYGCTIAHVPSFDQAGAALREVKPTLAVAVPRVYEKIYASFLAGTGLRHRIAVWASDVAVEWAKSTLARQAPGLTTQLQHAIADRFVYARLRERLGGRVRFFVSGGAPLSVQIALFFYGAGIIILEGYGLTETSPVTNVNTLTDLRLGTVGRPVPGTEIRIADDGEVLVRGPQVMKGYFDNPAATREAIDAEGWFATGDIGALDEDGYLRITDRKKDLLKTAGGKFVAPQPIQDAAKRSRFVAEALLIGDRRPYPILIVVPNFPKLEQWAKQNGIRAASPAELVADARVRAAVEEDVLHELDGVARHELPKKLLMLDRELTVEGGEVTPTLKVKRRVVEERLRDRIEALYAEPAPAEPS